MKNPTQGSWQICRGTDKDGKPILKIETRGEGNDGYELATLRGPDMEANAQLMVTSPKMLEALEYCQKVIEIARHYFPKSIKNSDSFMLENCCATVGKAIHEATGEQS